MYFTVQSVKIVRPVTLIKTDVLNLIFAFSSYFVKETPIPKITSMI